MRRTNGWLLAAAALLLAAVLPARGTETASLQPAQVLLITEENGRVTARCDSGASGVGDDLERALFNMERTANGTLFLGTVEYVILGPGAYELLPQAALSARLRPAARVCCALGTPDDLEALPDFFTAHRTRATLAQEKAALLGEQPVAVPILAVGGERMELISGLDG